MKQKSIVVAALLSLIVIGSSLGRIFLPEWCVLVLLIVFVFGLVYIIEKLCIKEKSNAIDLLKDLSVNVSSAKNELLNNLDSQKNALLGCLSKNQEELLSRIAEVIVSINKTSQKRSEVIIAKICAQTDVVNAGFAKELERINCFEDEVKQISTQLVNRIISFSEDSQKLLNQMCTNIILDIEKSRKLIDSTSLQLTNLLSTHDIEVKNIIESSSVSFVNMLKEQNNALNTKVEELSLQEDAAYKAMSETLGNILQMNSFVKTAVTGHYENLAKKIDFASNSLLDSITKSTSETSSLLTGKVNELCDFTDNKSGELLESIKLSESNVCGKVQTNLETAVNSFNTICDVIKKQHETAVELVLKANNDYSDKVQEAISVFSKQYEHIENVLIVTQKELNENTLHMRHALADVSREVVDSLKNETANVIDVNATKVDSGVSQILQSVSESSQTGRDEFMKVSVSVVEQVSKNLIDKLNSIEKQRVQYVSSIEQKLNQQRLSTDKNLQNLQENYDTLNKCIENVSQTSLDVKDAIGKLSVKNDVDVLVDSVKTLISGLSLEVKDSVSSIESQILDAQVGQEGINSELKNLQILLRALLKSKEGLLDGNAAKSLVESGRYATSDVSKNNKKTLSLSKGNKSLHVSHDHDLVEPNPNRQETILDSESGNLVLNSYKDNLLVKSTMKDKSGHVIFEMEYAHGNLIRSKNYDDKGNVNVEQTYYDNGQVHFRNEFTKNGKVSTEFDNNGKRK